MDDERPSVSPPAAGRLASRRLKLFRISGPMVLDFWKAGLVSHHVVEGALPEDARVAFAWWDAAREVIAVVVESDEFDEVPDGSAIPEITAVTRRVSAAVDVVASAN